MMADESQTATGDTNAGESAADGVTDVNIGGQQATGDSGQAGGGEATPESGGASTAGDGNNGDEGGQGEGEGESVEYGDFDTSAYPEGYSLNEEQHAAFLEVGKKHGLPQEAMQELMNFDAQRMEQINQSLIDKHGERVDAWADEVRNDETIGGAKLEESLQTAAKALDAFGTPELRKYLSESGMGNHPELVRFVVKVGQAVSEDKLVTGDEPQSKKSTAEKLYPSMAKQA